MKEFYILFDNKRVNLIPETGKNIGLALTIIELGVKKWQLAKTLIKIY